MIPAPALALAAILASAPTATPVPVACRACPDGRAEVVFVAVNASRNDWQVREMSSALDAAERWTPAGATLSAAVIVYNDSGARVEVPMTRDLAAVRAGFGETIASYQEHGQADKAAQLAAAELVAPGPCRLVIFASLVKPNCTGWTDMKRRLQAAAVTMHALGVPVIAACPARLGSLCSSGLERAIASDPALWTVPDDAGRLAGMVAESMADWTRGRLPWMCETPPVPTPTAALRIPTPRPTETPTMRYTPTATTTATLVEPTPTYTYTPTLTHAPPPRLIYLPILPFQPCRPTATRADVVLVLDLSTSMERPTRTGRRKVDAALDAARAFVGELRLTGRGGHDHAAVVGFNAAAWVETGLTDDGPALGAALGRLAGRMAEGTRQDSALDAGRAVVRAAPAGWANRPVVILLTDGLPNRVPTPAPYGSQEQTVLAAAAAVKAAGIRVIVIGLGDDVDAGLLRGVASGPADYFEAPDGEDLAAIYRTIAGRVTGCPAR